MSLICKLLRSDSLLKMMALMSKHRSKLSSLIKAVIERLCKLCKTVLLLKLQTHEAVS